MPDHPPERLSQRLRLAHEAVQQRLAAALAATNLAPVHAEALALIAARPGIKPSQLADALARDRSSVTATLHALQRRGLVRREATTRDRRTALLHVTDSGQATLRAAADAIEAQERLLDRLVGEDDKFRLIAVLHRIHATLSQGGSSQ